VNIVSVAGFISWWCISVTYIRFRERTFPPLRPLFGPDPTHIDQGLRAQGISRPESMYQNKLQPYLAYYTVFWTTILILISGITVFWDFSADKFVASYINIPLFVSFYLAWKYIKRTNFRSIRDMDFVTVSDWVVDYSPTMLLIAVH
jgi:yeast amino acid transporter